MRSFARLCIPYSGPPVGPAVFRGEVNLSHEVMRYVNPLYPMGAGLVRGVNDDLLRRLLQHFRRQL